MKLLSKGDVKVCRFRHQGSTHYFITPPEMRSVMSMLGEAAYCLYSYYRTGFFLEADDFEDGTVGLQIGWPQHKVKKYRQILEKADVFRRIRYGTKVEGITKVFVGADVVALFNAGLPADIIDGKAFNKLKKMFNVTTAEDLIENAERMAKEYERSPESYK